MYLCLSSAPFSNLNILLVASLFWFRIVVVDAADTLPLGLDWRWSALSLFLETCALSLCVARLVRFSDFPLFPTHAQGMAHSFLEHNSSCSFVLCCHLASCWCRFFAQWPWLKVISLVFLSHHCLACCHPFCHCHPFSHCHFYFHLASHIAPRFLVCIFKSLHVFHEVCAVYLQ